MAQGSLATQESTHHDPGLEETGSLVLAQEIENQSVTGSWLGKMASQAGELIGGWVGMLGKAFLVDRREAVFIPVHQRSN